jgi:hypothetical protein
LGLAVPKVNTLDDAPFTGQVNDAGVASVANGTAYLKLFLRPISITHDDAVEVHRASVNPQLDRPERSGLAADANGVPIPCAIHAGFPKKNRVCALGIQ